LKQNPRLYKKRQAIVEHPYGILKRQWGFYYIMTKKFKKRASADVGLMFFAFNLRRLINIIDMNEFKKYLKELDLLFFEIMTPIKENIAIRLISIFTQTKTIHFLKVA